jgi:hypothetical protein
MAGVHYKTRPKAALGLGVCGIVRLLTGERAGMFQGGGLRRGRCGFFLKGGLGVGGGEGGWERATRVMGGTEALHS